MTVISCHGCKFRNPSHLVGSKNELLYYSVGNWRISDKMFFCTDNCYKESVFVDSVIAEGARTMGTSPDLHLTVVELYKHPILGELADVMHPKFDEIVEPSLNHYSLDKFKARLEELKCSQ
jgi:hypothetical protein